LRLRNFFDYILSALPQSAEEEKQIQKMIEKLKYHCHFTKQKYKVSQFVFRKWVGAKIIHLFLVV